MSPARKLKALSIMIGLVAVGVVPTPGSAYPRPQQISKISGPESPLDQSPYLDDYRSSISRDGRFVAFTSRRSGLVPVDANATTDVFVHDTSTGETELASI